jgi:hypothetical protein
MTRDEAVAYGLELGGEAALQHGRIHDEADITSYSSVAVTTQP